MDDAAILSRLFELDLELPPPPTALATYIPCVLADGLAHVSGQVPPAGWGVHVKPALTVCWKVSGVTGPLAAVAWSMAMNWSADQ